MPSIKQGKNYSIDLFKKFFLAECGKSRFSKNIPGNELISLSCLLGRFYVALLGTIPGLNMRSLFLLLVNIIYLTNLKDQGNFFSFLLKNKKEKRQKVFPKDLVYLSLLWAMVRL